MSRSSGASQSPKTFTVGEAEALLPKIIPLLEQLQSLYAALERNNAQSDETTQALSDFSESAQESARGRMLVLTAQQQELAETFEASLAILEGWGCILKDLRQGLVDFYAIRDGKLVFLCWKMDETGIRYWHSLEGGFAARAPIDEMA